MEHRRQSNISEVFERGCHQPQSGRAVAPEIGYYFYPTESIQTNGPYCSLQRDLEFRPFVHSSSSFIFKGPNHYTSLSCQSYDSFPQFPACRTFYPGPENPVHTYSGYPNWHTSHKVESGLLNHTGSTGRGPLKRRRHELSIACESVSTRRHHSAGSSSNSFEFQLEQPISTFHFSSTGLHQSRDCSISYHNEYPSRNVRRRYRLDSEISSRRTYQSDCFSHHYYPTSHNTSGAVDFPWLNADANAYHQNNVAAFSAAHGRFQTSGSSGLRPGIDQNSAIGFAADIYGYSHGYNLNRNPFFPHRHLHGLHAQAARQDCNSYSQRTIPSYRGGLTNPNWGRGAAASENGLQYHSESYSSRCSRPFSAGGWHSNHWDMRSRVAAERVPSLSIAVDACDHRIGFEAQMMVNHSSLYASRNMFDQYRDMRLDIDNMSYEELLALGERIGNVSTGLSKDRISKCLANTVYSSLDENKKEGTCPICLEDYREKDEIGAVKNCRHVYHAECIKNWLSMKNACPICQAPALAQTM